MVVKKKQRVVREVRRTTLIVVEGKAEEVFVRHLVSLYAERGKCLHPTIKNARGKGGAHVLDIAIRNLRNGQYDQVVLVLDTDVQWGHEERKVALSQQMILVENTPCFEALLLAILGIQGMGPSKTLKKYFIKTCGGEAHKPEIIQQYFPKDVLERNKSRVSNLQTLISVLV